jgi:hypothetical protein
MGIAALCCGVAGMLLGLIPFMFIATGALAACAIVFAATGIQRAGRHEATNRGMAIGGLITGVIAALMALWGAIIVFSGLHSLGNDLGMVQSDTGASAARLQHDLHVAAYDEQRLIRQGAFIGNISGSRVTPPTPVTVRLRVPQAAAALTR